MIVIPTNFGLPFSAALHVAIHVFGEMKPRAKDSSFIALKGGFTVRPLAYHDHHPPHYHDTKLQHMATGTVRAGDI
jgi:hypothetical protein